MHILLTSVLLTVALLVPNLAKESQNLVGTADTAARVPADSEVLNAPKTAFLTLEQYASHTATEAGIDPVRFQHLIRCESQWVTDAAGDSGTSLGLLQFKKPTFAHFIKKYPIADADMGDPRHQIELAAAMIADGHLRHWKNCARKIGWSNEI